MPASRPALRLMEMSSVAAISKIRPLRERHHQQCRAAEIVSRHDMADLPEEAETRVSAVDDRCLRDGGKQMDFGM